MLNLLHLLLLFLLLSLSKQDVSFTDLIAQVSMVTDKFVDIDNASIEKHTCDLTSSFTKSLLDSSINSVTDSLLLLVFILNSNDLLNINLNRCKLRLRIRGHLLLLLLLHLLRLRLLHLSRRYLLVHHVLLRDRHWHVVIALIHSLLLVHVSTTATTTTLSSMVLIVSIVVILSLHVVILILVIEVVTTYVWNKFIKSHSKRISIRAHELSLREHLKHLATLQLLFCIDIFFRHPEVNAERLATEDI